MYNNTPHPKSHQADIPGCRLMREYLNIYNTLKFLHWFDQHQNRTKIQKLTYIDPLLKDQSTNDIIEHKKEINQVKTKSNKYESAEDNVFFSTCIKKSHSKNKIKLMKPKKYLVSKNNFKKISKLKLKRYTEAEIAAYDEDSYYRFFCWCYCCYPDCCYPYTCGHGTY
jgi:hypothetical protein